MHLIRRWLGIEDKEFTIDIPFGRCEARFNVFFAGMQVSCGKFTNMRWADHWVCSEHNPKRNVGMGEQLQKGFFRPGFNANPRTLKFQESARLALRPSWDLA